MGSPDKNLPFSPLLKREEKCRFLKKQFYKDMLWLFLAAYFVRLLMILPAGGDMESFFRTDTPTYMGPALSLLHDFTYSTAPGSGEMNFLRTPLYPFFLCVTFFLSGKSLLFTVLSSIFVSSISVSFFYGAARKLLSRKYALLAGWLFLLNPTAIAHSPLFLSDTLFTFFTLLSLWGFLFYIKKGKRMALAGSLLSAGLSCLTRPLALLWVFPAIFVICCIQKFSWKKRSLDCLLAFGIFFAVVFPWIFRNYLGGAGWRIDAVSSGTSMHNRSALESRLTGIPGYRLRERYEKEAKTLFQKEKEKYASLDARLSYHEKNLLETVKQHPFSYLMLHFRHEVLLPDIATFFEDLGLTTTGRNTWDVINREGIWAGVKHYFAGRMYLPFIILPLLVPVGIIYLGAVGRLLFALWKKEFFLILLFLLFSEYFLFMTGPIAMPRYQMPALPFIYILGASFLSILVKYRKKRKNLP